MTVLRKTFVHNVRSRHIIAANGEGLPRAGFRDGFPWIVMGELWALDSTITAPVGPMYYLHDKEA